MGTLEQAIGDYKSFVKTILEKTKTAGFDLNDFSQMDRICYRTSSKANYEQKVRQLQDIADLVSTNIINGRPIAVFRLREPIRVDTWRIDALEVPAPKPDHPFADGLEHAEFVLFDTKEAFLTKYSNMSFNLTSSERGVNPEIGYKFDTYGVKFHLLSLLAAIYIEKKNNLQEIDS